LITFVESLECDAADAAIAQMIDYAFAHAGIDLHTVAEGVETS